MNIRKMKTSLRLMILRRVSLTFKTRLEKQTKNLKLLTWSHKLITEVQHLMKYLKITTPMRKKKSTARAKLSQTRSLSKITTTTLAILNTDQ